MTAVLLVGLLTGAASCLVYLFSQRMLRVFRDRD